jgi:hypothetical protein
VNERFDILRQDSEPNAQRILDALRLLYSTVLCDARLADHRGQAIRALCRLHYGLTGVDPLPLIGQRACLTREDLEAPNDAARGRE